MAKKSTSPLPGLTTASVHKTVTAGSDLRKLPKGTTPGLYDNLANRKGKVPVIDYSDKPAKGVNWDKVDTEKLKSLVPYLSNIVNSFRKPPMPAAPIAESAINLSRVSLDGSRQAVKDQVRTVALGAESTMSSNAAAAAKVGAMGEGLRALNGVGEREALINAEQRDKEVQANAGIRATNNQRLGAYRDAQVDREIAIQRESSANLANATDKFVMQENEKTQRSDDMKKLRILKDAFNYQGVGDRTLAALRQVPELKGLFANGGELPGPVKPLPGVTPTTAQAQVQSFVRRRQDSFVVGADEVHTGGQIPKVTLDGKEIPFGTPVLQGAPKYNPVPRDVSEFQYVDGVPHYTDPRTGDMMPFDPVYTNLPQFRKTSAAAAQPLVAKRAYGGRLLRPVSLGKL